MKKNFILVHITLVCATQVCTTYALNYYPQFYLPRTHCSEPRLAPEALTTVELTLRGGHANEGYDGAGNKINPLALYGCENLYQLTKNVPQDIINRNPTCLLNTLWHYDRTCPCFAKLATCGKYTSIEFLPVITQNFSHGFFASLTIPIKKNTVKDISYTDLTPRPSLSPDIDFIAWQSLMNTIEESIQRYGTCIGTSRTHGLGDIQLYGGWTINYERTRILDYIDGTLALGINFASSSPSPSGCTWCLPLGYEGHTGIPLIAAASIGVFDWFTLGIQTGALCFFNKQRLYAIKTADEQTGWIRLTRVPACVHKGTIWHVDEYIKFDHIIGGFSVSFGFEHDHANRTHVCPLCPLSDVTDNVINSDIRLMPWTMTTFNFALEFDFATFDRPNLPRLAITVDKTICGKRCFDAVIPGAYVGIDVEW